MDQPSARQGFGDSSGKAAATGPGQSMRLLRIEDVADRLAVSRSMAWKLVAIGELKSLRIGRSVRVRPEDLETFIAEAEREL